MEGGEGWEARQKREHTTPNLSTFLRISPSPSYIETPNIELAFFSSFLLTVPPRMLLRWVLSSCMHAMLSVPRRAVGNLHQHRHDGAPLLY